MISFIDQLDVTKGFERLRVPGPPLNTKRLPSIHPKPANLKASLPQSRGKCPALVVGRLRIDNGHFIG